MNDLISRQAAIDALNKMKIYRPLDSDRYVISDCLNKIVNLPSAQPERTETHSCDYQRTETHDLVSRDAVIKAILQLDNLIYTVPDYIDAVRSVPTVESQRMRGKWIKASEHECISTSTYIFRCSECGETFVGAWSFCPNCGADMRETE